MKFDVNNIIDKMDIENHPFYQHPVFKPFIQLYLKYPNKTKYKLFYQYIFQYNKMRIFYENRDYVIDNKNRYFNKQGKLNLRKKFIREDFYDSNAVCFIGYTYQLNPLFLYLHLFEDWRTDTLKYHYSGFRQELKTDKHFKYLSEDVKRLNKVKSNYNICIDSSNDDNIFELSKKTQEFIINQY